LYARPPVAREIRKNDSFGIPGMSPKTRSITDAVAMARGCSRSCPVISAPRLVEAVDLVTSMPAAVETIRAGICVTRPSPMVRSV
jgi:hypothetical protein